MNEQPMTFADQAAPLAALALLMAGHRDLPALCVQFDTIVSTELMLAVHNRPGVFDAWLAAIAPKDVEVTTGTQSNGNTHVRKARFPYAGATVVFTDYSRDGVETS
jgi:hypothetical protein